ncbi:MAG: bifunctional glutamate N-acetyltransferase/amino-acid acetyltransferase ArgJ [Rhodobacteraceae bacterium]|nr:bifunctional glutamate N-acetyltransferase/amino-acid acetyltransferase ArgJ [Paracoccaceae bacterium]MCY4195917.1 bifunctional glutamate N-acetyltransferase/amino-acid acetyltransferase ArgJ [Paracoccaceae bacterium]
MTESLTSLRENARARQALLPVIAGAEFATAAVGIRYHDRPDLMLARLAPGSQVVGFFTRSTTRAAPVLDCEEKFLAWEDKSTEGLAILVNSGNANAFTGEPGLLVVRQLASSVAKNLKLSSDRVLTASTGVIGEKLETSRILMALDAISDRLSPHGLGQAADAIMTTDTYPKCASTEVPLGGGKVKIAGIAKGSGMIQPDMATLLAFVFTDAKISRVQLHVLSQQAMKSSFNAITVDGDTSTNDTLIVVATGQANHSTLQPGEEDTRAFADGLNRIMISLAQQTVGDGEGATKLVRCRVKNAASEDEAWQAARSIANSPLVKTAIAGEDPNWGRIVMAVGKSGVAIDQSRMEIWLGCHRVAANGMVASDYSEEIAAAYMKRSDIDITVSLGSGTDCAEVTSCDLTHGYVEINADYRS